jgi:Uma2 family endonuclease
MMSTTTRPEKMVASGNATGSKRLPRKPARPREKFVSLDGLFTVEQWSAMPDVKPRYELLDGKLVQKMTTTRKHSKAAGYFLFSCLSWVEEKQNGWQFFPEGTGVMINVHRGFVPDVVGFAPDAELNPDETVGDAPFLVVEVLSPSTSKKDRTEKRRDYAAIGVQLFILIDTDARTVEVYRCQNNTYGTPEVLEEHDVWQPAELPGLRLELTRLWM